MPFSKEVTRMNINIGAFLSLVLVTTFTPGPNNISSASMGVLHGYKKTLRYLAGIATGFFFVMLLCGWISTALLKTFPSFETALRFIGAGYILWLAFETLRASYTFETEDQALLGFMKGLLLQVLNPKAIVYGLTLYSTFLAPIKDNPAYLGLSAFFLTAIAFCSVSIWALFGSAIRTYLHQPRIRQAVNLALSLLLVYTAVELSGLI
jgi:cysteine/O-acetylserine efflux protein